ncbi:MAG: hypothetical protein DRI89_00905 [Bacteroidetes bacterium]|nr:MAG: hypothetical protein DRI89_00905 [Bacteroidota bacterium]
MNLTEIAIIFTPLTFLPGIGMLIMSTSRRYIELINQMQRVFQQEQKYTQHFFSCQQQRLRMFKWALTFLYLCVGLVLLGSLLGGITISSHPLSEYLLLSFVILAVLSALLAVGVLIRESFVSASLINEQFDIYLD